MTKRKISQAEKFSALRENQKLEKWKFPSEVYNQDFQIWILVVFLFRFTVFRCCIERSNSLPLQSFYLYYFSLFSTMTSETNLKLEVEKVQHHVEMLKRELGEILHDFKLWYLTEKERNYWLTIIGVDPWPSGLGIELKY